jgi:hypothetical protein
MPGEHRICNELYSLLVGSLQRDEKSSHSRYYHELLTAIVQCCARCTINSGQIEHTGMNFEVLDGIMSSIVDANQNKGGGDSVSIYASLQTLLAQCNHVLLNVGGNISDAISILPIQVIIHQPSDQVCCCILFTS